MLRSVDEPDCPAFINIKFQVPITCAQLCPAMCFLGQRMLEARKLAMSGSLLLWSVPV